MNQVTEKARRKNAPVVQHTLKELTGTIKSYLAQGAEYYTLAGQLLIEAHDEHFDSPKEFWGWTEIFDKSQTQLKIWMDMGAERNLGRPRKSQVYESQSDFLRKRERHVRGHHGREPEIQQILNRVDTEALAREAAKRRDELTQVVKLANQIIDIGFKTLAQKLHPDKRGGSERAMVLLNAARDRLRRHL
jgi:hypothetical protein